MLPNGVSQGGIDEFTRISPIAWTHTLFTGGLVEEPYKMDKSLSLKRGFTVLMLYLLAICYGNLYVE